MIELFKFTELNSSYEVPWTDDAGTLVKGTDRNGTEYVVSDYGNNGPIELWAIQKTINSFVFDIKWEKLQNNDPG